MKIENKDKATIQMLENKIRNEHDYQWGLLDLAKRDKKNHDLYFKLARNHYKKEMKLKKFLDDYKDQQEK